MSKGQFEIMGLAIVVVIISVGIFFMLSVSLRPPSDPVSQGIHQQFAQNVVDALLKTDLDGCPYTVQDAIVWKATDSYPSVPGNPRCATPAGLDDIMGNLTQAITMYSGMTYHIEIRYPACTSVDSSQCTVIYEKDNGCNPLTQQAGRPGIQPIPTWPKPGQAQLVVWLCEPQ